MNKLIYTLLFIALLGCNTTKKTHVTENLAANAPFIVYKTAADYSQNVPVILSEDKQTIVSYPAPRDLLKNGELRVPTQLINGFLLDNKGINRNVAFTSYTYANYSKMENAPSIDELKGNIVDKDPLTEMYDCSAFREIRNDIKQVNRLLKKNLGECVKLK